MSFKYFYLLLLLKITTCSKEENVQKAIKNVEEDTKRNFKIDQKLVKDAKDFQVRRQGEGIFVQFIKNLLDAVLITIPGYLVRDYIKLMGHQLKPLEYEYSQKLVKYLTKLSNKKEYLDVRNGLVSLRAGCDNLLPHRKTFLDAMNKVYTLKEGVLFGNYLLDLKDFGQDLIPPVDFKNMTRKMIYDGILNPILQMSVREQKDLKKKMKAAYNEYSDTIREDV